METMCYRYGCSPFWNFKKIFYQTILFISPNSYWDFKNHREVDRTGQRGAEVAHELKSLSPYLGLEEDCGQMIPRLKEEIDHNLQGGLEEAGSYDEGNNNKNRETQFL